MSDLLNRNLDITEQINNLKQSNLGKNPNQNTVLTAVKQVIDLPSNLTKPHNVSNIQNAPIYL